MQKSIKIVSMVTATILVITLVVFNVNKNEEVAGKNAERTSTYVAKESKYTIIGTDYVLNDGGYMYYVDDEGNSGRLTFDHDPFENIVTFPEELNDMEIVKEIQYEALGHVLESINLHMGSLYDM